MPRGRKRSSARSNPLLAPDASTTTSTALERTSASNTSLLIALNPVITLLLSPLVGERLDRRRLGGVGLALAGAVVVITHGDLARLASLTLNAGDLIALAAAVHPVAQGRQADAEVRGNRPSAATAGRADL